MENEKRLIDVNLELRKIRSVLKEKQYEKDSFAYAVFEAVMTALEKAPTVDAVEVVHGRWECEHETWGQLQCSVCKKQALLERADGDVGQILLYVTSNYCPNCGAKMDGDGNGM